MKARLRLASSALGAAALLLVSWALAFPAQVQVVAKVSVGKNPKLVVHVNEAAQKAVVTLKREDGRSFTYPLGNVSPGLVKEIQLDGRVGRHTYEGEMTAEVAGEKMSSPLSFETVVATPLSIQVSRKDLDLKKRTLNLLTSREITFLSLKVIGLSGSPIEEIEQDVEGWQKDKPITVRWKRANEEDLVRLEVRVEDRDGFFNAVSLTPWSVEIPHEEVHFATGSAEVDDSEVPKLQDSLERIEDALQKYSQIKGVQLFIAGHTDTQGGSAYNMNLSRNRARAIAAWFVRRGLPIAVSYEGFGESALKVKTKDEVDEPRNRRVDYILSVEPPPLTRGGWKRLN
jgi:outer membrane protein OmpA-like peptidoglycan-associated protein